MNKQQHNTGASKMNGASQGSFTGVRMPADKRKKILTDGVIGILTLVFFISINTLPVNRAFAQKLDTANKLNIEILPSDGTNLQYIETDSGGINKLIHNVRLKQDDTYMYCDSAYINLAKNNMQAFGNVKIVQTNGTQVESDYLRYTGNTKKAFLSGNVSLTNGKDNLWSEELNYDVAAKTGTYEKGGTLQSDATTLSSNTGMYNARTKDSRFTGEVYVTDPRYNVVSDDLAYNTGTEVVNFLGPSIVTNDSSELRTSNGTWDAKNEIAHFNVRSSLQDRAQYIEANKMDYNRQTGLGIANGNVICIDTAIKGTLYCDHAQYNEITKQLYATEYPVMKKMNGEDSLFIRADTFYSAPVISLSVKTKDSSVRRKNIGKNASETIIVKHQDSSGKRYFIGYHHVLIYSDSLQAKCDSISYSQADSIMQLMYDPIVWSRNAQITGDTILLYSDSSKLRKIYVPNKALIISQSGPEKAGLFDQVQGNTLIGYFENNNIREAIIYPNVEAIYYSTDDAGAYIGVDESQSERMKILFDNKEISDISQYQDIRHKMTPMRQALNMSFRLSRFHWLKEQRPRGVQQLFDYGKNIPVKKQQPPTPVKSKTKKESTVQP